MTTQLQNAVEQILRSPSRAPIITDGPTQVTASELRATVEWVQQEFDNIGLRRGQRVIIELDRSVGYIAAIVACIRSGITYVPVSSNTPPERREAIVRLSGASGTIGLASNVVCAVRRFEEIATVAELPTARRGSDPLAYIIYTSGTTGSPKGVAVTHDGLWRFAIGDDRISMSRPESCLCCSSVSFDASVYEIWPTLLGSGTVHLYASASMDIEELCDFISVSKPDRAFLTTKLFQAIEQSPKRAALLDIGQLFVGGETISPQSFSRVREQMGKRLRAAYGPTEAVVFTTLEDSDRTFAGEVPIGSSLNGKEAYVLDEDLRPCELGTVGEIYIRGGLAAGYYSDLATTAIRFVPCPFVAGSLMYRTGDLGVALADGTIGFRGRTDGQVKIRGYRVELGAIESFYLAQPEVSNCVCVVVDPDATSPKICLYFTSTRARVNSTTLRRRAESVLEAYMTPDLFVQVDQFETNDSGKIDRLAMPRPYMSRKDLGLTSAFCPADTEIESFVISMFERELRIAGVGVDDNFYELGGNSLNSMSLQQSLSDAGYKVTARQLFSAPSPRALSAMLALTAEDVEASSGR